MRTKFSSLDPYYGPYDTVNDALVYLNQIGSNGKLVAVYSDKTNGKIKLYSYNDESQSLDEVSLTNDDRIELNNSIISKVDKVSGKDLVLNTEITKLSDLKTQAEITSDIDTKVNKVIGKDLVDTPLITKLSDLKTQAEITSDINNATSNVNASVIPITGTTLPRGGDIPAYITNIGKSDLYGGTGGTTYTNTGTTPSSFVVNEGFLTTGYYNKITDVWTLGNSVPMPRLAADGIVESGDINAVSGETVYGELYGKDTITEDVNYYKDLSTYTTLVNNTFRYVNNVKTLNDKELLKSVTVKAPIGSVINVYAYKITGANGSLVFEELHHFGSYTTTLLTETHEFSDSYKMPLGTFIGISSSKGIYYKSATLFGTHPALTAWTNIGLSHSFATKIVTNTGVSGVYSDIDKLDIRVSTLENSNVDIIHKFNGKKIVVDGDSLMEQGFVTSLLTSIIGCTIINRGKSGSGYVMNMNGTLRSRADGVGVLEKDCILIGSGGTNDWRNSKPLGSSDVINDDTQFYSAVYNTFRTYREQNPTTPILVCTPTQGFYSNGSNVNETRTTKYNGRSFSEFVQVIRDVAKIFSIQVCDLYDISGITYENRLIYTSDGLHVNTLGGRKMAEKIVQDLNTLVI